jgi:hypothetical protein
LSNGDAAEWKARSLHTAPLGLPFSGNKSTSGFRTFDFDIRVQHFRFITESKDNMERPVELVKRGNAFFLQPRLKNCGGKKFYMPEAM